MSFYIGLSLLSNNGRGGRARHELLTAEGRRILSLLEGRSLKEDEIAKNERGRPFLPGNSGDFSISHSHAMAAVSLVKGEFRRTGCDIQIVQPRVSHRGIAERFFSAPERDYIFACGDGQFDKNRFFEIWALKECFLKLRGLSVFDMASVPSFILRDDSGSGYFAFEADQSLALSFHLYELRGNSGERYFLAAALEGSVQDPPEIRWFSQSLPSRHIAAIKAALSPASTVSPKM